MNFQYITSGKKTIAYLGWIGYGNLGDEAIYLAVKKMFSPYGYKVLPFKYSKKIQIFESMMGRSLFCATVLGGGTLINTLDFLNRLKSAQMRYQPSFLFGVGVQNPLFWNGKNGWEDRISDWVGVLKQCSFVGVRGPLSKKILDDYGFNDSVIVGDTVLSLGEGNVISKKGTKRLGINIRSANSPGWEKDRGCFLKTIVDFAKIISDQGWEITFLPMCFSDEESIRKIVKKSGKSYGIFSAYHSVSKTMDFLRSCDVFIGEKLHSVILACCANTPSIMLEYRPKCLDFMLSMELEEFNVRNDNVTVDFLLHLTNKLYADITCYQQKINAKIKYYNVLQNEKIQQISKEIMRSSNENTKSKRNHSRV